MTPTTNVRPLLIGACPPLLAHVVSHSPLYPYPPGCAGHRLQRLTGLSRREYLRVFDRLNLVADPEFSNYWSKKVAAIGAANLLRGGVMRDRYTVLLGRKVREAFGAVLIVEDKRLEKAPMMTWLKYRGFGEVSGGRILLMYHPSGRARVWNEEGMRELASLRLGEAAASWGADL